ncbi:dihydrofolate reductase [Chryseobacterium indologenes]|uniref:dihydrofolate reductase family protein n=1 Tax=Chryseobacterium indologenes TaxID=253 RepID=UPI000BFB70EA|nr:dihydrofolate reductase family protein [Chryseobacterium indologenes]ATN04752.1 dihydrofolate reductase [Chryseobacterium indologenes]AYY86497.1 dihydrofolate reductase [Chryseobacterium indologenes]QIX83390.1 dihydrofolate reductase [Chryseobacterium indologenes]UDQ53086.1 dihydrofolate reductase family protein [Chryseobacterium indologenes]HAO27748.1 dihydrofolate reductase [Chryseobacterium indologenes]
MRKITVLSMITMDGVMQAPGGPDEDRSGGFKYGGWTFSYSDDLLGKITREELKSSDYLLGRKTFDIFAAYWPSHADFWPSINEGTKYVLSQTMETSDWKHSVFLKDIEDIKALKESEGPEIQVWGSSELIHLLLLHDLVDEIWLKIFPLILGEGKKLFDQNAVPGAFVLKENHITSKGVIIARYQRAGEVVTGEIGI